MADIDLLEDDALDGAIEDILRTFDSELDEPGLDLERLVADRPAKAP